jgi:hypothetical protein
MLRRAAAGVAAIPKEGTWTAPRRDAGTPCAGPSAPLAAALASCVALVALAAAQGGSGDEQAITITARAGAATVTGADGLRPGPARRR